MTYLTVMKQDGTGVLHFGRGAVTGAEILAIESQNANMINRSTKLNHMLIDFSEVISIDVTSEEVQQLVLINQEEAKLLKVVFVAVAAPSDLTYGISRMYAGYMRIPGWVIQVFRTRIEAENWLKQSLNHPLSESE